MVISEHHQVVLCFFFFKQKTAYEMRISDWSSDVCSSDLSLSVLRYEAPAQAADYQALGRTLPGRRDRDGSARQSSSRGQTGSGSGPDGDVAGPRDSRP